MAIQVGTVDGLVNITEGSIQCFVQGIDAFVNLGGPAFAKKNGVPFGVAFQRFVEPVYTGKTKTFDTKSISTPVFTSSGAEQSPSRGTYCKKMGLLKMDESKSIFEITPLGKAILNKNITIQEYAFILLSKMGIFVDDAYKDNLLQIITLYFNSNAILSQNSLSDFIKTFYKDSTIVKTRLDIIISALALTGLVYKVAKDSYVLSGTGQAELLLDYYNHSQSLCVAELDTSKTYSEYMGNMDSGGIFDILSKKNIDIYTRYFHNLEKYLKVGSIHGPRQQIYYGAPGTGKSHEISELTRNQSIVRTTFHPDSDYSTFVGAYKPTMEEVDARVVPVVLGESGTIFDKNAGTYKEKRITYSFVKQAFLKAYLGAWEKYAGAESDDMKKQFLIIEEINRGNCAQIFGDLFQLLDRKENGFSEYPIEADTDLQQEIERAFREEGEYKLDKDISVDGVIDYTSNYGATLSEDIQHGRVLLLPPNLYIWATMNTSDQSLFPIDSAFKRRWEWKYVKIAEGRDSKTKELLNWIVKFDYEEDNKSYTFECKWWDFIIAINEKIAAATSSDDKKLGYFFCKPKTLDDKVIDAERFIGKVVFYLWNDVFKDEENAIFKVVSGNSNPSFDAFYTEDEDGNTIEDTKALSVFMHNVFGEHSEFYTVTTEETTALVETATEE